MLFILFQQKSSGRPFGQYTDGVYPCSPLGSVGIAPYTTPEGIQFPRTRRHFVGHKNSSNVHADLLLAPYHQYWQLDHLVARVCCKASSDACQKNLLFTESFLALHDVIRMWCHNSWHHNHTHCGKPSIACDLRLKWLRYRTVSIIATW